VSDHHGWKAQERKIAAALGKWWDNNPKHFRRLPLKAGAYWDDGRGPDIVRLKDPFAKVPSDDIIDYTFPLFCEVKKRKILNLNELVGQPPKNPKGNNLTGWFNIVAERATRNNKWPMLFAKFPRSHKTFLILPKKILKLKVFKNVRGIIAKMPGAPSKMRRVFVCEASEFFANVTKKMLKLNGREEVIA